MHTDRARLLQCLLNLLSNAVKYTEEGEIRVAIRQRGGTADEGESLAEITVADTGIGISEEDQARLFHPFVRFDSGLRSTATGTGLGLYLTRKIVMDLLQGSISFTSRPGEGSSFTLRIPVTLSGEARESLDA
jgi:signal transduction histidine kinase